MRFIGWVVISTAMAGCAVAVPVAPLVPYQVAGDSIPAALTAQAGQPERGREIVSGRDANCLLCHAIPATGARFMGNIGPELSGIGARLSVDQLRLRVVAQSRLNPETVMPSYYQIDGLTRVAPDFRGKPVLTAQQVEDVVAFLATLK